ncbi:DUF3817 domain-containing protein [Tistrella bauzanensis]
MMVTASAGDLRRLRLASMIEGTTLVLLICVAVPLKHLWGVPEATRIMGPIHGLAFLAYLWVVTTVLSAGGWRRGEAVWLVLAAFIPFGAITVAILLRRKGAECCMRL